MSVPKQESERSGICVIGINFASFNDLIVEYETVPKLGISIFHFINGLTLLLYICFAYFNLRPALSAVDRGLGPPSNQRL